MPSRRRCGSTPSSALMRIRGWLRFDVVQDDEDPSRFYYYESCEDAEAAKVHAEAEHTKAFRAMTEPWRAEPNVIRRGTPIAP